MDAPTSFGDNGKNRPRWRAGQGCLLTLQTLRCIHAVRPQPPTNIQAAACLCRQILSYDGTMMASLKSFPAAKGLSRTCVEVRGMRIYWHFRSPGCCIFWHEPNRHECTAASVKRSPWLFEAGGSSRLRKQPMRSPPLNSKEIRSSRRRSWQRPPNMLGSLRIVKLNSILASSVKAKDCCQRSANLPDEESRRRMLCMSVLRPLKGTSSSGG